MTEIGSEEILPDPGMVVVSDPSPPPQHLSQFTCNKFNKCKYWARTENDLSFIRNLYCKEDLLPNLSWRESSIQESCLAEWDHFLFSVLVAGWVLAGLSLSVTFQSDVNVTNTEGGGVWQWQSVPQHKQKHRDKMCHLVWRGGIKPLMNVHHEILQIPSQNPQSWAPRLPTPAKYFTNSFHMWPLRRPNDNRQTL